MNLGISSSNAAQLNLIQAQMNEASTRLASGKRVNSAKDDAAGLAIISRLETIAREFDTGMQNASNAVSVVEIADGAVAGIESNLQRLRELSIQSANGILSDNDRAAISAEAEQLKSEISRTIDTTQFNGKQLLSEDQSFNLQLGGQEADQINFSTTSLTGDFLSSLDTIDLSTEAGATDALTSIDAMLETTTSRRSEYGSLNNRFESVIENLSTRKVSVNASKSQIEDADFAKETAKLSQSKLLENATIAIQAQANASAGSVLALLKT